MRQSRRLQNRIMICFLILSMFTTVIVCFFYVYRSENNIKKQVYAERQLLLEHAVEGLNAQVSGVNEFVSWIDENENIQELLARTPEEADRYDYTNYDASNEIRQQFTYRSITNYIIALAIIGDNGVVLCSGPEGYLLDEETLARAYRHGSAGGRWGAVAVNPNPISHEKNVIPYYHALTDSNGNQTGILYFTFSTRLISDETEEITDLNDGNLYVRNQDGNLLYGVGVERTPFLELEETSNATNWSIEYNVSTNTYSNQMGNIWRSVLVFGLLLVPLIIYLSKFLSENISAPVEQLAMHIRRIGKGDFEESPGEYADGEIGELNAELTRMGSDIQKLLQTEKDKKQLELALVQAQLNPHFLHNTLSSIRTMAGMQGNKNVTDMIDALNLLLRANLSSGSDLVALGEEAETAKSYLFLQNIRLKGRIRYRMEIQEEIREYRILKNILQPIAENAVMHGIGNNPLGGSIMIRASLQGENLEIAVEDDGAGMTEETLEQLRRDLATPGQIKTYGHGIGLYNTNARIRLCYGENYGIKIESKEGRGSRFVITLPYSAEQQDALTDPS